MQNGKNSLFHLQKNRSLFTIVGSMCVFTCIIQRIISARKASYAQWALICALSYARFLHNFCKWHPGLSWIMFRLFLNQNIDHAMRKFSKLLTGGANSITSWSLGYTILWLKLLCVSSATQTIKLVLFCEWWNNFCV